MQLLMQLFIKTGSSMHIAIRANCKQHIATKLYIEVLLHKYVMRKNILYYNFLNNMSLR